MGWLRLHRTSQPATRDAPSGRATGIPSFGAGPQVQAIFAEAIAAGIAQEVREVRTTKALIEGGQRRSSSRVLWRNRGHERVLSREERERAVAGTCQLLERHGIRARSQGRSRSIDKAHIEVDGTRWTAQREALQTSQPGWSVTTTGLIDRSAARHAVRPPQGWATNPSEVNVASVTVGFEASRERAVYIVVGNSPTEVAKQVASLASTRSAMASALPLTLAQDLREISPHFLFTGKTADYIRCYDTRPLEAVEITTSRSSVPAIANKLAALGAKPMAPDGQWRSAPLTANEGVQKLLALKIDDADPQAMMVRTDAGRVDVKVVSEHAYQQMYEARERRGSDRNPLFVGEGTLQEPIAKRERVIDLRDSGPSLEVQFQRPTSAS